MRKLSLLDGFLCVLMTSLVVVVFAQVLLRYLTYQPLAWTEEAARFIFIWLCLLGAAAATWRGRHFAVDILPRRLPQPYSRVLIATLRIIEAVFYVVITWAALEIVQVAQMQAAPTLRISMGIPYASILVGGGLMALFSLRDAARAILGWTP